MPNIKITDLSNPTGNYSKDTDLLEIVDTTDTTQSAQGSSRKVSAEQIRAVALKIVGIWDASTNETFLWETGASGGALVSGVGSPWIGYGINVAGNTNLDGTTDWHVGDFVLFNPFTNTWMRTLVTFVNNRSGALTFPATDKGVFFADSNEWITQDATNFTYDSSLKTLISGSANVNLANNSASIGGLNNNSDAQCTTSFFGGGSGNTYSNVSGCLVGGGETNTIIESQDALLAGGTLNDISNITFGGVAGGENLKAHRLSHSFVGGGQNCEFNVDPSDSSAGIGSIGGFGHSLVGGNYSGFVAGYTNTIENSSQSVINGGQSVSLKNSTNTTTSGGTNISINNAQQAFIGGGQGITVNFLNYSGIIGGFNNSYIAFDNSGSIGGNGNGYGSILNSFVGGGTTLSLQNSNNMASLGGAGNSADNSVNSFMMNGNGAVLTAAINSGTIGGDNMALDNCTNSYTIGGKGGVIAHDGVLSLSDNINSSLNSQKANSAFAYFTNGFGFMTNNPQSGVSINDSLGFKTQVITGGITAVNNECVYFVNNTTTGATLINISIHTKTGRNIYVKDIAGNAVTRPITLTAPGFNIDGSPSFVINTNFGKVHLIFNGTNFSIIST